MMRIRVKLTLLIEIHYAKNIYGLVEFEIITLDKYDNYHWLYLVQNPICVKADQST